MTYIDGIRAYIDRVLDSPDSREAMIERTRTFNSQLRDDEIAGLLDHLEVFVRGTPDLIELAEFEAFEAGVHEQLEPLFQQALSYFLTDDDLIPDHLGLYGLLDDAYLAQKYLLAASARHEEQAGTPLLGERLRPALSAVSQWIGAEVTEQLDQIVERDLRGFSLGGALLTGALGLMAVGVIGSLLSGNGGSGGAGSWGNSWEAETSRMAAGMGLSLNI